ncbi:IroE protein [Rostrohypoxylon terebratum]|nr:IroE protein [Rostrohypoxylon terebratum]
MLSKGDHLELDSSEVWPMKSQEGREYSVQIGYPRDWGAASDPGIQVPVVYLTDGNAFFLTALEALHRRLSAYQTGTAHGIVVAIGYPILPRSKDVFEYQRRQYDLTLPTPETDVNEGGAEEFFTFINDRVRPFVHRRIKDTRGVSPGREALYGHSLGGLFALHNLFTHPDSFDCFIASSPSIWWHDKFIFEEARKFLKDRMQLAGKKSPSLMICVGSQEQDPPHLHGEPDEQYAERQRKRNERHMIDNAFEMYCLLKPRAKLENIAYHVFEGEDHGTVMACSLNRGMTTFFESWVYREH